MKKNGNNIPLVTQGDIKQFGTGGGGIVDQFIKQLIKGASIKRIPKSGLELPEYLEQVKKHSFAKHQENLQRGSNPKSKVDNFDILNISSFETPSELKERLTLNDLHTAVVQRGTDIDLSPAYLALMFNQATTLSGDLLKIQAESLQNSDLDVRNLAAGIIMQHISIFNLDKDPDTLYAYCLKNSKDALAHCENPTHLMSFMGGAITEKKLVKADFLRQYHTKKKALVETVLEEVPNKIVDASFNMLSNPVVNPPETEQVIREHAQYTKEFIKVVLQPKELFVTGDTSDLVKSTPLPELGRKQNQTAALKSVTENLDNKHFDLVSLQETTRYTTVQTNVKIVEISKEAYAKMDTSNPEDYQRAEDFLAVAMAIHHNSYDEAVTKK
jgi:hypothetical protein